MLRWAVALIAVCCLPAEADTGTSGNGETGASERNGQANPWATMRGCIAVLERFVACAGDRDFREYRNRWIAEASGSDQRMRARIQSRLRRWLKPEGRRGQCAAWATRDGASEHVAEDSALAKLARDPDTSCVHFATELERDGWLVRALGDTSR